MAGGAPPHPQNMTHAGWLGFSLTGFFPASLVFFVAAVPALPPVLALPPHSSKILPVLLSDRGGCSDLRPDRSSILANVTPYNGCVLET